MKKNYITPEINVIQPVCDEGFLQASVFEGSLNGDCISNFDVVNEDVTKTDYKDLWGGSNSGNWGDD